MYTPWDIDELRLGTGLLHTGEGLLEEPAAVQVVRAGPVEDQEAVGLMKGGH